MKFTNRSSLLMMVRPASFGFNDQTAGSNKFQQHVIAQSPIHDDVLREFDTMVGLLHAHDISVEVFHDTPEITRPDAVFPNNWITFHTDGRVILYPMMAPNRRAERRSDIIVDISTRFHVREVIDLTKEEDHGRYLEGTGSLVFDHCNKIVYACISERTHPGLVRQVAKNLGYKPVLFDGVDENGTAIYHTNVMMSVGAEAAVLCLDAVRDEMQQDQILESLASTGHKVVAISYQQMRCFAGNILEVSTRANDPVILMSETAFHSLLPGQINALSESAEILSIDVKTIEKFGGGSVRCMVAEVNLPVR